VNWYKLPHTSLCLGSLVCRCGCRAVVRCSGRARGRRGGAATRTRRRGRRRLIIEKVDVLRRDQQLTLELREGHDASALGLHRDLFLAAQLLARQHCLIALVVALGQVRQLARVKKECEK